jgi:hypothetical protein
MKTNQVSFYSKNLITNSIALVLFLMYGNSFSQALPTAGDCLGAFRVCELSYTQASSFVGEGNIVNELPPLVSCLLPGERNNAWYTVTIQNDGLFGFNIVPNLSNSDYDWVVFDITNATCNDISLGLVPIIGCDFSSNLTPSNLTGMNNGVYAQDEPMVNVPQGAILALCITNFFGLNDAGYTLHFDIPGTTATILDETAPNYEIQINDELSNDSLLEINFSEFIQCQSIQIDDFILTNEMGDTIPLQAISGFNCDIGANFERDFFISIADSIELLGNYTFEIVGSFEDACENVSTDSGGIAFSIGTPTDIGPIINSHIKVLPNPAADELNIVINNHENVKESLLQNIHILDSSGRIVLTYTNPSGAAESNIRLNVQDLPAGLYRVVLNTSGNTYNTPFVKL